MNFVSIIANIFLCWDGVGVLHCNVFCEIGDAYKCTAGFQGQAAGMYRQHVGNGNIITLSYRKQCDNHQMRGFAIKRRCSATSLWEKALPIRRETVM